MGVADFEAEATLQSCSTLCNHLTDIHNSGYLKSWGYVGKNAYEPYHI
jgi:hypothetical protein